MSREPNETPEDRERERIILTRYAEHLGMSCTKLMPWLFAIDAVMHEGTTIRAWVELKCRNHTRTDSYMCSLAKLMKLYQLNLASGKIPAYFLVVTPTESVQIRITKHPADWPMRMSGNPRGQPGDYEPCVFLPRASFEDITSWGLQAGISFSTHRKGDDDE